MKGLPKLQLLRPIATRWESLVDAMIRLLKVRSAMTYIMLEDKAAFMDGGGSTPKNKADTSEVARICCSPDFWEHLDVAIRHLAPLKVSIHHLMQQSDLHVEQKRFPSFPQHETSLLHADTCMALRLMQALLTSCQACVESLLHACHLHASACVMLHASLSPFCMARSGQSLGCVPKFSLSKACRCSEQQACISASFLSASSLLPSFCCP